MMILEASSAPVTNLAFSDDGELFAAGSHDGSARIWDLAGECVRTWNVANLEQKTAVAFQPRNHQLVSACKRQIDLHSWEQALPDEVISPAPGSATCAKFISNELLVIATGKGHEGNVGGYYLYDVVKRVPKLPIQHEPYGVPSLDVHLPSKTIVWCTGNKLLRWATITKPGFSEMRLGQSGASVSLHPSGKSIAVAIDWKVRTFDMPSRTERQMFTGHKGIVTSVAYHVDGSRLASGSWDETVRIWDTNAGVELACFEWKIGRIHCVAYSPDGTRIAAGSERGIIAIWDAI